MHCTYNGVGSLTSDKGCGIALIEYDDTNNPKAKGLFALPIRNQLRIFFIIIGSSSQKYF